MYGLDIGFDDKEYVESIKYYSGTYWQQVEDTTIKDAYGNNRLVAFAISPEDLFIFWECGIAYNGKTILRIFDVTNVDNFYEGKFNWYKDIFVGEYYGRYRLNGLIPAATFVIVLGFLKENRFERLLQSNFVKMPNNTVSTNTTCTMATKVKNAFRAQSIKKEILYNCVGAEFKFSEVASSQSARLI